MTYGPIASTFSNISGISSFSTISEAIRLGAFLNFLASENAIVLAKSPMSGSGGNSNLKFFSSSTWKFSKVSSTSNLSKASLIASIACFSISKYINSPLNYKPLNQREIFPIYGITIGWPSQVNTLSFIWSAVA